MWRRQLLVIDAGVNLFLGGLLLVFPAAVVTFLGVPPSDNRFYPSLLGAVLSGIGVALLQESRSPDSSPATGLGLRGAVTINLCAGFVLAGWLLIGSLNLPVRGVAFLWFLVVLLIGISGLELVVAARLETRNR